MRLAACAALLLAPLVLAGCNQQQPAANDDMKKDLDQLVQASRDLLQTAKDNAASSKATSEDVKALSGRLDKLNQDVSAALAKQKRGALYLALDQDAACDNDDSCMNTARAICNRINYPNGLTSKVIPGVRPTLHALVCYD